MQKKLIILSILLCSLNAIGNTQLPILPAEVVARDLDITGLGAVGHVGITMAGTLDEVAPWVVEVLNETRVVQVNYISTFKTRSPYWGSRYGIANDRQSTLNVLREANSQRCLRSNYTITSISWPATGDLSGYPQDACKTQTMGQFRCDTFMSHVFGKGGYNILRGAKSIPRNIFLGFPKGNGDGPHAFQDIFMLNDAHTSAYSIDTVTAQELASLTLEEFVSIIDSPANSTKKHIDNKVWGFYKESILSDFDKRYFLLDYLGGVATPALLPDIIIEYSKTKNSKLKYMLLKSTQSIYTRNSRLINDLSKKELLRDFYINLLNKKTLNDEIPYIEAKIMATGLIDLSSRSIILENIKKINSVFDQASPYERIGFKSDLMLDIKLLESTYIPEIIRLLQKENNRQLDERFFSYIISALFKDTNNLSSEIKDILKAYLSSVDYKSPFQPRSATAVIK